VVCNVQSESVHRTVIAWLLPVCGLVLMTPLASSWGNEPDDYREVASKLLSTTVTVRILPTKAEAFSKPSAEAPKGEVTVCSGVSVARGLVVTFDPPPADRKAPERRYRVTLPDGQQAKASSRVIDHYSGLALVAIDKPDLPALELAAEAPAVGARVLTAAAAGIERPVVSLGIVGGVDRSLAGTGLPPLVQCDVRTTEASVGAAVVDRQGKLLGVIAATTGSAEGRGWTYAVPAKHIQRLLDAQQVDRLIVLDRRRPTVGLTMGAGNREGLVEVERVEPGGPADRAGIRKGDVIVEADGRKIRSAYQAVDLILNRQPGDKLRLLVDQEGAQRTLDVTLGSSSEPIRYSQSGANLPVRVGPQIRMRTTGPQSFEVGKAGEPEAAGVALKAQFAKDRDELSLLRRQLEAFEKVIAGLQDELQRRERTETETRETVERLERELSVLRRQLRERENDPKSTPPASAPQRSK
jgi:S1-C subfamily serine protease